MLVQFFHSTTDIKSWLVAVEDPTVQVVQLREILKSGRIGFILHCDIVSVVVMMIEFWQLSSVEGNTLWMTIWQTNTTCDVTLLGNLKLPRQKFFFMSTQFQIDVFSLSPMFLYTGQLEHVLYHHCEVDIITAHPQHNHHSLRNSSNSAVYQPQVADAGRCPACCAAAHCAHQWRPHSGAACCYFQHVVPGCGP